MDEQKRKRFQRVIHILMFGELLTIVTSNFMQAIQKLLIEERENLNEW